MHYDLFFDESGLFIETSKLPQERIQAHKQTSKFASQLAGVLVPHEKLTTETAERTLNKAYQAAGIKYNGMSHATEINANYVVVVGSILEQIGKAEFQPVRMVNKEQVSFGDRVANYTNIVAEMLLRVFQQKALEGEDDVAISVIAASVTLKTDMGDDVLKRKEYVQRIDEYLTQSCIRRGIHRTASQWKIADFSFSSGAKDPRLQICDLISNASHDEFKKCSRELSDRFRSAFGNYDQSFALRDVLVRTEEYIVDGSLGMAMLALCERLTADDDGGVIKQDCTTKWQEIVDALATCPAGIRDAQLSIVGNWVGQSVEMRTNLVRSAKTIDWLLKNLHSPLETTLPEGEVDWLAVSLIRWEITTDNHLGDVRAAADACRKLDQYAKSLAGDWEHATTLMEAFVSQAVHWNDCFEHEKASDRMSAVAEYYQTLSTFFHEALPDVFPERVRSDLRGKALGTQLQSEVFLSLRDPSRIDVAREVSDDAIAEFKAVSDKQRQYQYRCELEVVAREYPAARDYLAKSIDADGATHTELARRISDLDGIAQAFALLHWLRLGADAILQCATDEADEFLKALRSSRLLTINWCREGMPSYPSHGILRRAAIIQAALGERDQALSALAQLRGISAPKEHGLVFVAILGAALAETGSLLMEKHEQHARKLFTNPDKKKPGCIELLKEAGKDAHEIHPNLAGTCDSITVNANCFVDSPTSDLIGATRLIWY